MQLPLKITWRDVPQSDALEAAIRRRAEKLNEFAARIMSCHVVVSKSHRHHQHGNLYCLHIDIHVPGKEIAVTREPGAKHSHENMYVVVRDAFDAARRQLQNYSRKQQGVVKAHDVPQTATIARVFPAQNYGFITTSDGDDIYFHRNALINADLESLQQGMTVHYVEEIGDEGPQAKQVSLLRKKEFA